MMLEKENEIIFLGTGTSQGVPPIGCTHPVCLSDDPRDKRLRASVMIKYHGKTILIDCGPDFRQQMLREDMDYVDAILVTHEHNDHIIGLDDMRAVYFKSHKVPVIYSIPRVLNDIKVRFPYAFTKFKYPGVPTFDLQEIEPNKPFFVEGIEVLSLHVLHGGLPILGFRIGGLAYITDVKIIPPETLKLLEGLDILVIDALRQKKTHHSHLLLDEAIQYGKQIGAKQTYFTHISHNLGFYKEVEKTLPEGMHLAYDQLRLKF
ncbi:MBL fold metallo-hydrolase [Flavobacteriaceae bacterium Ap0902]|nr:MBL fold metallo-hydrolase [Flavobacteriaceae bacterium Ap0902]